MTPLPQASRGDTGNPDPKGNKLYVLEFVNRVRTAQGYERVDGLPTAGDGGGSSPLELAMGCRLEAGLMRMSSPAAAEAVNRATGLPVGVDRVTITLPAALNSHASVVQASRIVHSDHLAHSEAV